MNKGERTKSAVLNEATDLASRVGLAGLTIGSLAAATQLSKSGLYAHFTSKESLQVEVLERARERFVDVVLRPALSAPRGEGRVRAFVERWLAWQGGAFSGGCVFISAASEYDDREGPVREALVRAERDNLESIVTIVGTAVSEGDFRADLDIEQFAFDLEAIMLGLHHARRLIRDPQADDRASRSLERLIASARTT